MASLAPARSTPVGTRGLHPHPTAAPARSRVAGDLHPAQGWARSSPPMGTRGLHPHPFAAPARSTPMGTRGLHPRPFAVKTRTPPPQAQFDELLIWVLIGLLALGLVMVYSASIATAEANKFTGYQPAYYC